MKCRTDSLCKVLLLNLQKSQVFKFSLNWGRTQAREIYFNLNKKHIEPNFSGILFFKPLFPRDSGLFKDSGQEINPNSTFMWIGNRQNEIFFSHKRVLSARIWPFKSQLLKPFNKGSPIDRNQFRQPQYLLVL